MPTAGLFCPLEVLVCPLEVGCCWGEKTGRRMLDRVRAQRSPEEGEPTARRPFRGVARLRGKGGSEGSGKGRRGERAREPCGGGAVLPLLHPRKETGRGGGTGRNGAERSGTEGLALGRQRFFGVFVSCRFTLEIIVLACCRGDGNAGLRGDETIFSCVRRKSRL